jgi:hypothetical protein
MKIFHRWVGPRPAWAAPDRANRDFSSKAAAIPEGQRLPSADHELTGQGQHDEKLAVMLDDRHRVRTEPDAARGLKLDQDQAKVVLAALEDAAALRREAIGYCPDCRSSDERVCIGHRGSWDAADEYDWLRWQLDGSCRTGQAGQERRAAALDLGERRDSDAPEPDEYVAPAVLNTSRCVPPEVYQAIGDYAREVNRPVHGPDAPPYLPPDEEAAHAELFGDLRADSGPTEDQIIGGNEANDYWDQVGDYEPDREAGE